MAVVVAGATVTRTTMRAGLKRAGLNVVAESDTARDLVAATVRVGAAACVIAADLPGDRNWAIRSIRAALPDAVIVIVARAGADDDEITDALDAGAAAYVCGPAAAAQSADAVSLALEGHTVVPRGTLARRARWMRPQALPEAGGDLTAREREVLESLLDGATTAEIATELGLSAVTVRRHVSGVVRKVGSADREALMAAHATSPSPAPDRGALTARELEVLRLAAAGRGNAAIADELFITPSTVKNHLTRIMDKLGARNRTEAAVLAARQGDL